MLCSKLLILTMRKRRRGRVEGVVTEIVVLALLIDLLERRRNTRRDPLAPAHGLEVEVDPKVTVGAGAAVRRGEGADLKTDLETDQGKEGRKVRGATVPDLVPSPGIEIVIATMTLEIEIEIVTGTVIGTGLVEGSTPGTAITGRGGPGDRCLVHLRGNLRHRPLLSQEMWVQNCPRKRRTREQCSVCSLPSVSQGRTWRSS
jgi:hypothetical protein